MSPPRVESSKPHDPVGKALLSELKTLRDRLEKQNKEIARCTEVERSLRESEEKYRFLVENSKDIIWKIDLQGRWMFVSSNVERYAGYRPDEIVGKMIWDFLAPEYYDTVRKNLQRRIHGEEIPPYEVEIIAKDGHRLPFEVLTTTILDNKGQMVGVQGISRDVAFRIKAKERLKKYYDELEERVKQRTEELDHARSTLQAVLETVPIGIIVADAREEKITLVTKGAEEMLKCRIKGLAGCPEKGLFELLRPDGSPFPPDELPLVRSLRRGERVSNVEVLIRRKDGSQIITLASSAPVMGPGGRIMAAVVSLSDITHLKRTEAALRDAKEQTELYLDLMGHDINNMNHAAMGYLEIAIDLIEMAGGLDAEHIQLLQKPMEIMNNSSRLIDNVRKIQHIKECSQVYEAIDLGEMLEDAAREYSHVAGREVTINFERKGHFVVMANQLLKDVFANIMGNAIKHSTGPLVINIKLDGVRQGHTRYYRVAIDDNGPGIPDTYKAELMSRKKFGGKGLGLYLARSFVKQFNGIFRIEDRIPGKYAKGARFVVMLPAMD